MAREFDLRAGSESDTEALLFVHVAAIIAHGPAAYTDREVAAWAAKTEGTDRYEQTIAEPETNLVVAEAKGRVVGFAEVDTEESEIESVFVDPEDSGQGVGSALLAHCERQLRDEEFETVRLRAVLNAVGFYEQHGYEHGERVTTTTTNDIEVESVWMEKQL